LKNHATDHTNSYDTCWVSPQQAWDIINEYETQAYKLKAVGLQGSKHCLPMRPSELYHILTLTRQRAAAATKAEQDIDLYFHRIESVGDYAVVTMLEKLLVEAAESCATGAERKALIAEGKRKLNEAAFAKAARLRAPAGVVDAPLSDTGSITDINGTRPLIVTSFLLM
jgi:hypothetical protein